MAKKLMLLIEDDWELRGNGLGNVAQLQYTPSIFLMQLAEEFGFKVTFMVEGMQQLEFKKHAQDRNLRAQAQLWEENVCLMKEKGHDVQLHLHPQWFNARYENGFFYLNRQWNLANYQGSDRREMIGKVLSYLKELLHGIDPLYQIHSFKAGSWGLQPSEGLLKDLEDFGIRIVMGVGKGINYHTKDFYADYSNLEETAQPYYPDYKDIQKISSSTQKIVVLPLPSYSLGMRGSLSKIKQRALDRRLSLSGVHEVNAPKEIRELSPMIDSKKKSFKNIRTFDLGNAKFDELKIAIDQIIPRYLEINSDVVPLVIQSHTKCYEGNWSDIRRFFDYVLKRYGSLISFQTMTEFLKVLPQMRIVQNA
jgi:hypothetical protein